MRGLATLCILVVDDHPPMRKLVASLLRGFGFRDVHQAGSSQQAWAELQSRPVDILLLDAGTVGRSAIDLVQKVRRDPRSRRRDLAVIWMSAFTDRERVIAARDAGISELLVKPICAGALFDRIVGVIDRPRPFVASGVFVGPDRRRVAKTYTGSCRRGSVQGRSRA